MKARIYNGQWAGNHLQEWINANKDKEIGGELVSEWQLTEVLPNEQEKAYLKLMFDGENYYEGATPEEIAEQELEKQKILKQQQYEELLPTDWYVIRFIERGIEIPEEIKIQRQAILDKYST